MSHFLSNLRAQYISFVKESHAYTRCVNGLYIFLSSFFVIDEIDRIILFIAWYVIYLVSLLHEIFVRSKFS